MERYCWSRLNKQQVGAYTEYFVKMELTMFGFQVYSTEATKRLGYRLRTTGSPPACESLRLSMTSRRANCVPRLSLSAPRFLATTNEQPERCPYRACAIGVVGRDHRRHFRGGGHIGNLL
jgi:hypothetical protein